MDSRATYSPKGVKAFREYRASLDQRVAEGALTESEAAILAAVKMQGIALEERRLRAVPDKAPKP